MAHNIVHASKLPRAIAKEKDGIVLYWVEELGVAGIHQNALAALLGCETGTVQHAIKGVKEISFLDAETITVGGLQAIKLLSETDLAKLLRHIARSKAKQETRDRADDIRDRLAAAGFKLMVMMELAPAELAARATSHLDKEIELQKLKNEGSEIERDTEKIKRDTMAYRDAVIKMNPPAIADRILGVTNVDKIETRTKVVDQAGFILNAGDTVSKTDLAHRYGFVSRTGRPDTKLVASIIEDAIEAGVIDNPWKDVRVVASSGFDAEFLPELDRYVKATPRQRQLWMGE